MVNRLFYAISTYSSVSLLSLMICSNAAAEQPEPTARDLFKQARELVSEGKFAEACPYFEQSLSLELGLGTKFNLADCWEHIGRTASAREMFLQVAREADDLDQMDRSQMATERAKALLPKLSRLQIRHDSRDAQVRVSRNDIPIERDDWTKPTAVDPGHYEVRLTLSGNEVWTTEVDIPAKAATVLVTVPHREQETAITPVTVVPVAPVKQELAPIKRKKLPNPAPEQQPATVVKNNSSVWPAALFVAGVAGVGVGTLFALLYKSKNDQASAICPLSVGCSDSDISRHGDLVSDAEKARVGAYLGFGLGAAGITAATILFTTRTKHENPQSFGLTLSPTVAPGRNPLWGASAQGTW
jgi:tetratricopeptide (TPR) repeat protein